MVWARKNSRETNAIFQHTGQHYCLECLEKLAARQLIMPETET